MRSHKDCAFIIVQLSNDIVCIKGIATLRAELGRILGILWLPSAFIALVLGYTCGLGLAALRTELTLVL